MSEQSENVVQFPEREKPSGKKILLLSGICLVVVAVLGVLLLWEPLNMDAVRRGLKYGAAEKRVGYGTCRFDIHSSNRFAAYDNGLLLANSEFLRQYRENGEQKLQLDMGFDNPALQIGKEAFLCYDVGGSELVVSRGGEPTLHYQTDGDLFDAELSSGDTLCIAAAEEGYKTVLRVYDCRQKEVFRWFSSSQFLPVCAVSPNGKHMAAISLGQSEGVFESKLNLFRTDSEEVEDTISLGDRLVYELHYLSDDRLCVVAEDHIFFLTADGETEEEYDLSSYYLSDYDFGGDGFLVAALNMYKAGNRCTVTTLDYRGRELGSAFVGEEILDISAAGKYLAVLTTDTLTIYHRDLSVYERTQNRWIANGVRMREDGSAYLLTGNEAQLYIP